MDSSEDARSCSKNSRGRREWSSAEQENNRMDDNAKYRKNRGGIAKSLQYETTENTEQANCEPSSIPLYRLVII